MKKIKYTEYDECLYSQTLSNGLKVNILPKKGFNKTYAILTSNFGSMDESFEIDGKEIQIPAGTAHFLEHKLFEKADYDAFQLFTKNGADSNAFTSYSKTSYLFSATDQIHENLDILLDFVQNPYFSENSVAKEQGIIGQEIQMYNDDVDWQLYMGILNNLYPKHSLSNDIAGTVDSIAKITPKLLYQIHEHFYHPTNMNLFVTGNLNPEQVLGWILDNQSAKTFVPAVAPIKRLKMQKTTVIKEKSQSFQVERTKVMLGINNARFLPEPGIERLRYLLVLDFALYLILSSASKNYLKLYDQGLLDDTFGYDLNSERDELFMTMGGDTKDPDALSKELIRILKQDFSVTEDLAADFELAKKEMYGRSITRMNSLEAIANSFEGESYGNATIFDEARLYQSITLDEVAETFNQFIKDVEISTFKINKK